MVVNHVHFQDGTNYQPIRITARYKRMSILLTKTTATQNEAVLSYHRLRGLCFLAVVFVRSIPTH